MDIKGKHYEGLKVAWRSEKQFIVDITKFVKDNRKVDAVSAGALAKLLQEKLDVIRSLECSMRKAYCDLENKECHSYYLSRSSTDIRFFPLNPEIQSRIEWDSALFKLNRMANPLKPSEESGRNRSAAELDGIKKTLQELDKKMQICMASVLKGNAPGAMKAEDPSGGESVSKIEKLAAEQETIKKTLRDLSEKTCTCTAAPLKKNSIVDDVGGEKVGKFDDEHMRLIMDLLQEVLRNAEEKAEEGTVKNAKSLVIVKKLLEEWKTVLASDLKDVGQTENNEDEDDDFDFLGCFNIETL